MRNDDDDFTITFIREERSGVVGEGGAAFGLVRVQVRGVMIVMVIVMVTMMVMMMDTTIPTLPPSCSPAQTSFSRTLRQGNPPPSPRWPPGHGWIHKGVKCVYMCMRVYINVCSVHA